MNAIPARSLTTDHLLLLEAQGATLTDAEAALIAPGAFTPKLIPACPHTAPDPDVIDHGVILGRLGETVTVWGVTDDRDRIVVEIDDGAESVDAHLTIEAAIKLRHALGLAILRARG